MHYRASRRMRWSWRSAGQTKQKYKERKKKKMIRLWKLSAFIVFNKRMRPSGCRRNPEWAIKHTQTLTRQTFGHSRNQHKLQEHYEFVIFFFSSFQ